MASHESCVWLNGRLEPSAQTRISPWDAAFLVGCGAFETLRAYGGKPFAITRHWHRLERSCGILGLRPPTLEQFASAMSDTLNANKLQEARVRFTVSGGEMLGGPASSPGDEIFVCTAIPAAPTREADAVVMAPWPRNERGALTGAKTVSYAENMVALHHARCNGAGEAIFANTRNELCEGAASNVFLVRGGQLHTPPLSSGCLAGVTRELTLEVCRTHGISVSDEPLPASALVGADEAFLTSSMREVQAIASVDGKPLSQSVGPLTRRVAGLFRDFVASHADP
ncbi:branched-chain amino acid aminotransferase [Roseimicrobium gellanilyticum]|uniref:branched-chain-amino-acid transaminase n=1 Tax=Roseimicrobium gellanilyticum TaxID=748857 RepID=A0A366HVL6_9BACT|nr:aminotransferase class IV [Roseimicrobium gellanilyticum]RBP47739.1 branched-chain amino acid aminotransferase [Roseimicrobium gellanilyticum]